VTEAPASIHVFEQAGLGKAPFRFIGHLEMPSRGLQEANPTAYNLAMSEHPRTTNGLGVGSCHFCGTPISTHCLIQSADGQTFFVGSDCVEKTGDAGLKAGIRRMARERNRTRNETRRRELTPVLEALVNDNEMTLAGMPHPNSHFARQGKTWKDYADWMMKNRTYSLNGTQVAIRTIRAQLGLSGGDKHETV